MTAPRLPAFPPLSIPESWPVSSLAALESCPVRAVAERSASGVVRLPPTPAAVLGRIAHRVFELVTSRASPSAATDAMVERAIREADEQNAADPLARHMSPITGTVPRREWDRFVQQTGARAESLVRERADEEHLVLRGAPRAFDPRNIAVGSSRAEVPLVAKSLRVHGRVDALTRLGPTHWEIRDYKTRSATDHDGEVRLEYADQLRAYALMLIETVGRARVELVVEDSDEHAVSSDDDSLADLRRRIVAAQAAIADSDVVNSVAHARVGPACVTCNVRPCCTAYLSTAPTWWKRPPVFRSPPDTWGTLTDVRRARAGTTIDMTDDAGRFVRCDALDPARGLEGLTRGTKVYVFGAAPNVSSRGLTGLRHHPRVFRELPRQADERRAWGCAVHVGDGTDAA